MYMPNSRSQPAVVYSYQFKKLEFVEIVFIIIPVFCTHQEKIQLVPGMELASFFL